MDERLAATDPTRDRVLEALRFGAKTVEALAGMIGVTRNAIRVHLATLGRDGLIESTGVIRSPTPGKPARVYALTRAAETRFSSAYPATLTALIGVLSEQLPADHLDALFAAAGSRLAGEPLGVAANNPALTAKRLLESLGAAVTLSAISGTTTMVSGAACPLAVAVRECPGSCEMVRAMLVRATASAVVTCCVHGDSPRCNFEVG